MGPIPRTVRDAALMLGIVAGPDPFEMFEIQESGLDYLAALERASVAGGRAPTAQTWARLRSNPRYARSCASGVRLRRRARRSCRGGHDRAARSARLLRGVVGSAGRPGRCGPAKPPACIEAPPAVQAVLEQAKDMIAVDYASVQSSSASDPRRVRDDLPRPWPLADQRPRWSPPAPRGSRRTNLRGRRGRAVARAPEPALHRGDQPCGLSGHHRAGRLDSGRSPSGPAGRSAPRRRCRCAHRRGGVRTSPTLVEPTTRTVGAHVTSELISPPPDVEIIGPSPLDSRADHHEVLMRDRVALATDVYFPDPGSLPAPAILVVSRTTNAVATRSCRSSPPMSPSAGSPLSCRTCEAGFAPRASGSRFSTRSPTVGTPWSGSSSKPGAPGASGWSVTPTTASRNGPRRRPDIARSRRLCRG